ncbi:polymorphic toxin-type HINT domain-containing protein [Lipingzhangella halophila]|uniref:polymorphic toxin-type HINT domain-containing protein n=1 Tax=Lipingzhangella halophila TaxID=1783352 RepID=UPI0028B0B753|nr:polymorphic toxin-type HINT domain-containing protein [Lipingzhangella halophila]
MAFDPATGEEGPREVTDLISSTGKKTLVDITTTDTDGDTATLTATDEHPFWAPKPAQWVNATDLHPGTWLRTSTGTWTQITAVDTNTVDDQQVHNLTIDDLSTYYAVSGDTPILVHNEDPCDVTDEEGLAAANEARSGFKYPGNMSGALYLEGNDDPIGMSSGSGNLPEDYERPPGSSSSNFHHLASQAAAEMRRSGIQYGRLYISGDYICGACGDRLERMLPDGADLEVTFRNRDGQIETQTFTGKPD